MNLNEYTEIVLSFVNKVDSMWNHFFAANAGIIVWLTSVENEIPVSYRITATSIYLMYMFVNFISIMRAYVFLNYSISEIKLNINSLEIKDEKIINGINRLNYKNRYYMVIVSYLMAIVLINYILWTSEYKLI